jgi:alginate O-acetyltransferase complex protein AlgI
MLFSQIEFLILLAVVLVFLRAVRNRRAQNVFLLLVSWYFYAYWDWRFLSLLIGTTVVDYFVGLGLGKVRNPARRKQVLVISIIANLGVLGFFKYFNFFATSLTTALSPLGIHLGTLQIILPVGVSFYTFQSMSYTIEVYRRRLAPCRDFLDYALFVAFFPQLEAGPIVRATDLIPQICSDRQMSWQRMFDGFRQFTFGLFKKLFIADNVAVFVDGVFGNAGVFDGPTTWLAVGAYAVQIYCDFSGYSDMAIGTARAMGFDFHPNFNFPYLSRSITEFWRRWHISLSSWLKDYLYIPLGGNRKGPSRTYVNLILTMLIGGLWHGAAWTFVFWGGLHGTALAVEKFLAGDKKPARADSPWLRPRSIAAWMVTLLIVMVGWVFFRSQGFHSATLMLDRMFLHPGGVSWLHPFVFLAIGLCALEHVLLRENAVQWKLLPARRLATPTVLFVMIWLVLIFHATEFTPFVYFQF